MNIPFRGPLTWIEGVVRSRPFHARIQQFESCRGLLGRVSRKRVASGTISRDSTGRVRYEYEIRRNVRAISIVDHESRRILTLDPQREIYFTNEIQYRVVEAKLPDEVLAGPVELIDGVECRRLIRSLPEGTAIEAWVSVELLVPVKERVLRGGVETVWYLDGLVRAEPDPSLFSVPRQYTLTDPS